MSLLIRLGLALSFVLFSWTIPTSTSFALEPSDTPMMSDCEAKLRDYIRLVDDLISHPRINAGVVSDQLKAHKPQCQIELETVRKYARASRYYEFDNEFRAYAVFQFTTRELGNDFSAGFGFDKKSQTIWLPYGKHNNVL
jgi:hypothetical protein